MLREKGRMNKTNNFNNIMAWCLFSCILSKGDTFGKPNHTTRFDEEMAQLFIG